jgi:UMF1 family MFS transporter
MKEKRTVIAAWTSFDFANSSFAMIMVTAAFPIFFGEEIVTDGRGDYYWGLAMSISMIVVALLAPPLGAIADTTRSKKAFLLGFTTLSVLGCFGASSLGTGMVFEAMLLFIIANAGFEGGIVFYDAFLPEITTPDRYGRVSGYGFAVGYIGSLAALVAAKFLADSYQDAFIITGIFFAVFTIPTLLFVPEHKKDRSALSIQIIGDGFRNVANTFRKIITFKPLAAFLLAFFLYNDAILTIIGFTSRYAKHTLGFTKDELMTMLIMVQIVAAVGSLIFGKVADMIGPRRTIIYILWLWIMVVAAAYVVESKDLFYFVAAAAGIALGSSQSVSRSMMALLTPKEHTAEFFGFYDGFAGKASAVAGPLLFGIMSDAFGQRSGVITVGIFFVAGLLLMFRVRNESSTHIA